VVQYLFYLSAGKDEVKKPRGIQMIFSEISIINGVSIAVCWLLIISVSFIGLKWLIKEDSEKS